jgi:dihydrolipoamide dehydrogenase
MVVGELAEQADLVVIGGGPGGYTAALHAAGRGREVTLIERGGAAALGGACLHVGCIPSKALIELACALHRAKTLPGLTIAGARVDLEAFQADKRELTVRLARDVANLLERAGVRVLHGEARFSRADRIAIQTPEGQARFLEFEHAILATGSRPAPLQALPFDGTRVLSSTDALALDALPGTMTVVGAGYIGVELGTAFAKLGVRVTLLEAQDRILPHLDERLVRPVAKRLEALGVEVRTNAEAGDPRTDVVLVATGRRPNTEGLDRAGIAVGPDGLVHVGPDRRATPTIAVIGDIVEGPALAHRAMAEAAIAVDALTGHPPDPDPLLVPQVVFSDPEIATVGLTERQATAAGLDARAHTVPLTASGRAATLHETAGFTTVVVDRETDRVVGVHLVGPHASELIAEGALAIELIASPEDLAATIHPHPTLSELLPRALAGAAR